jgi:ribosome-binding protein aMBF1 (putative translation factor)
MKKSVQQRLEAQGWRMGSAADFLELTPEESALIELKLIMARKVRTLRQQANLTQAQLAKKLHSSQSRIAKLEAADSSVTLDLLVRAQLTLGATRADIAKTIR